jgi:hypothetical protein
MNSYKTYNDSAYLRKEDFPLQRILTVSDVREEEVTAPGKKPKRKIVIYLEEVEKGLVLNQANGDVLFEMTGFEDPEQWIGQRVEVYNDPNVTYAGKRVGGIRLREPARASAPAAAEVLPF